MPGDLITSTDELNRDDHLDLLRRMAMIRFFEEEAGVLLDRGEILGSIHTSVGQEAVCVGACAPLRRDDTMTGHHRSHGHPIAKGADLKGLMAELMGRRTGVCHGNGGSMHLADFSVGSLGESAIVGSSLAIATGAGLAYKLRGEDRVCLAFFGDGASNAGIFHESLNMAGAWQLPVVFVCENNLWAVSTRHQDVCAVEQVADRAPAYGMPGEVVDGQDVLAVRRAVERAVQRARSGDGPTLIEAMTYRYAGHSHRLANVGSRPQEEVDAWLARDPITLFSAWLEGEGIASAQQIEAALADAHEAVLESIAFGRSSPFPTMEEAMQDMYASPPEGYLARGIANG